AQGAARLIPPGYSRAHAADRGGAEREPLHQLEILLRRVELGRQAARQTNAPALSPPRISKARLPPPTCRCTGRSFERGQKHKNSSGRAGKVQTPTGPAARSRRAVR